MYDSIDLTVPADNGSYIKATVYVAHITQVFSVIEGKYKGLTAVYSVGSPECFAEESREQIKAMIDAIRQRQHLPA